jgi:predicted acylesterase/phospholipase RssA
MRTVGIERHNSWPSADSWQENTQASFRTDSKKVPHCDIATAREVLSFRLNVLLEELYPDGSSEKKEQIANDLLERGENEFVILSESLRRNGKEWTEPMRYAAANGIIEHILFVARKEAISPNAPITIPATDKFTRLVLSGGGGKGAVYPVTLETLLKRHPEMFDQKGLTIAGSSAGGLAAIAAAFGFDSPAALKEMQTSATSFIAEIAGGLRSLYPSTETPGLSPFCARGVIKCLDVKIGTNVRNFLRPLNFEEIQQKHNLADAEMARLVVLRDRNLTDMSASQEGKMVTFADLALLRKVGAPFYDLEVTLYNKTEHGKIYANANTTPNLPIAFAGRGTMALPVMFRPLSIPNRFLYPAVRNSNGKSVLVDGGIGDNIPVGDSVPSRNILVLSFHRNGDELKKMESAQRALREAEKQEGCIVSDAVDALGALAANPQVKKTAIDLLKKYICVGFISYFLHWLIGTEKEDYALESYLRIAAVAGGMAGGIVKMLIHGNINTANMNPSPWAQDAVNESSHYDIQALVDQFYLDRGKLPSGESFKEAARA